VHDRDTFHDTSPTTSSPNACKFIFGSLKGITSRITGRREFVLIWGQAGHRRSRACVGYALKKRLVDLLASTIDGGIARTDPITGVCSRICNEHCDKEASEGLPLRE
jgi:hypothetical protein